MPYIYMYVLNVHVVFTSFLFHFLVNNLVILLFFPVYRAQFAKTIPESKLQEPYTKKMVGLISGLLAMSVILFAFLRKYSKCIGLCYL